MTRARGVVTVLVAGLGVGVLGGVAHRARPPRPALLEVPVRRGVPAIDGDRAVLVNGRRVTPAGRVIPTRSYTWGLAVSPDGGRLALVSADAVEVIPLEGSGRTLIQIRGADPAKGLGAGPYMGCAFSPDGRLLYFGSADTGQIKALDLDSGTVVATFALDGGDFSDSFAGDFVVSPDGSALYVLDQFNYRLVVLDRTTGQVRQSIRVGRNPFSMALSADGGRIWVTNVGMFEYPLLPGVTPDNRERAGLPFPAYGVPSKEAEEGTTAEGVPVPGLGTPNHPDAMSLMAVDLRTATVEARVKTGYLVGAQRDGMPTIGGASPGAVAAGRRFAYVSNATNDTVSIVDGAAGTVVGTVDLDVPGLEPWRGVLPFGLALAPDESRLYVACAGLNAVAVIDTASRRVEGYVPAGWFASSVALSPDGRTLLVSSAKGLGSGPNGGQGGVAPDRGLHPGDIMQGTLQVVPVPTADRLAAYTAEVLANTVTTRRLDLSPEHPLAGPLGVEATPGPIRHVVFVVKENRTFDQVFGQRRGVRGDPSLATLGLGRTVTNKDGTRVVPRADLTPNHHALADRFAISDNFYADADQSNTGHRWVAGVYPNEWVEVNARSRIEERLFSSASAG